MKVDRLTAVISKFMEIKADKEATGNTKVVVGYTQRYAIKVHEESTHAMSKRRAEYGKQSKFLEAPTRQLSNSGELGRVIGQSYRKTGNLEMALIEGGLRIQMNSQKVCPVDTSALRASAYTVVEREHDSKANAMFAESEAVRQKELEKRAMKQWKKQKARHRKRVAKGIKKQRAWDKRRKAWEKKHGWKRDKPYEP